MAKQRRSALSERKTHPKEVITVLEAAAETTYDINPGVWDQALRALKLDSRYQPAVAKVLRQGRWRTAANPLAYVATAAVRSAHRDRLPDYTDRAFRRVASDEPNSDVGTAADSAAGFNIDEWGPGRVYVRTPTGGLTSEGDDDDDSLEIPQWLQRGDEYDAVDWETVAAYAVLKPRMACDLARALIARLDLRLGRPEAVSRAASATEAAAIEAAWKWIDRNAQSRITLLFQMTAPPRSLAAADIASFPPVAPGVSLRVDILSQWDGQALILARAGLVPSDGGIPAFYCEADSEASALRAAASDEEAAEYFHFWQIEPGSETVNASRPSTDESAKPWEVLRRLGTRTTW